MNDKRPTHGSATSQPENVQSRYKDSGDVYNVDIEHGIPSNNIGHTIDRIKSATGVQKVFDISKEVEVRERVLEFNKVLHPQVTVFPWYPCQRLQNSTFKK